MSAASSAAQTLEVRAVGTVADGVAVEELTQLLVALSGAQPAPLEQLEVVLRPPTATSEGGSTVPAGWKPDLRLQHDLATHRAASRGAAATEGSRWAARLGLSFCLLGCSLLCSAHISWVGCGPKVELACCSLLQWKIQHSHLTLPRSPTATPPLRAAGMCCSSA